MTEIELARKAQLELMMIYDKPGEKGSGQFLLDCEKMVIHHLPFTRRACRINLVVGGLRFLSLFLFRSQGASLCGHCFGLANVEQDD